MGIMTDIYLREEWAEKQARAPWQLATNGDHQAACDVCGWRLGPGLCYLSTRSGSQHCRACHKLDDNWTRDGDSAELHGLEILATYRGSAIAARIQGHTREDGRDWLEVTVTAPVHSAPDYFEPGEILWMGPEHVQQITGRTP